MNKKSIKSIGACLILLSVVGAIICSSINIYLSSKVAKQVSSLQSNVTTLSNAFITQDKKVDDPQYVTIANIYEVRDTSAISDAYLKKETSLLTSTEDKETFKMASDLLNKITTDKMSLYEKELAIHDWLVINISTPDDSLSSIPTGNGPTFTPYGVLKYRKAVCVGYATTFKLLMNMIGADCMVEHNLSLSHSWNIVKLDDIQWYIVDVYSDSAKYTSDKTNISHQDFNVTNDFFNSSDPQFDTSLYPVASSTQYSYAVQNSTKLTNVKALPKILKKMITKKTAELYYELPANTDYNYISAVIQGIVYRSDDGTSIDAQYLPLHNNIVILSLSFSYNDDIEGNEENYPNLTDELDRLFGTEPII